VFFEILRRWVDEHRGGNVTTADFEELCTTVAGRPFTGLFDAWLRARRLPPFPQPR